MAALPAGNIPSGSKTPEDNGRHSEGNRTLGSRRSRRSRPMKTWAPSPDVPSHGSKNHFQGKCRPCFAMSTPEGCSSGALCNFCHFDHDDDNIDKAVQFSQKKIARRVWIQLEDAIAPFDGKDTRQPNCQLQCGCGSCLPMQNVQDSSCRLENSRMFARRNSAPAIAISFNPTLPFLRFPEADKMEATPVFVKKVLQVNDSKFIADVLMQNMPERYDD
jgi:hypothetical protein